MKTKSPRGQGKIISTQEFITPNGLNSKYMKEASGIHPKASIVSNLIISIFSAMLTLGGFLIFYEISSNLYPSLFFASIISSGMILRLLKWINFN